MNSEYRLGREEATWNNAQVSVDISSFNFFLINLVLLLRFIVRQLILT